MFKRSPYGSCPRTFRNILLIWGLVIHPFAGTLSLACEAIKMGHASVDIKKDNVCFRAEISCLYMFSDRLVQHLNRKNHRTRKSPRCEDTSKIAHLEIPISETGSTGESPMVGRAPSFNFKLCRLLSERSSALDKEPGLHNV